MHFRKYHGAGNDFIMLPDLDARLGPAESLPADLVVALCDRHTGVGADGVVRIIGGPADPEAAAAGAAYRFDLYNADGLPAEVSGNGLRCLVALERSERRIQDGEHRILTGGGVVRAILDGSRISIDMGRASMLREDVPMRGSGPSLRAAIDLDGMEIVGSAVGIGNPHFVIFVSDLGRPLDRDLVQDLGPRIEHHPDFPARVNVEFVDVETPVKLRVRTWERGVGETMACGSGACAVAFASAALQRTGDHVVVEELGGELELEIDEGSHVWLTGPAEEIFAGTIDRRWLVARGLGAHVELVAEAT
ncbi:MAG TPA: diaminopimelate epimerase [Actinomycetota bacterium]|jgi:diaminopimelate epimerase|nr:diaminopimelate epimerase [Actinomycetota bacterium]